MNARKKKILLWFGIIAAAANVGYFAFNKIAYRPDPRKDIERAFASQTLAILARNAAAVEVTVSPSFKDRTLSRKQAIEKMLEPRTRYFRDVTFLQVEANKAFIDYKAEEVLPPAAEGEPPTQWQVTAKEEIWGLDPDGTWRQVAWATAVERRAVDAAKTLPRTAPKAAPKDQPKSDAATTDSAPPALDLGEDSQVVASAGEAPSVTYTYNPLNRRDPFKPFLNVDDVQSELPKNVKASPLASYNLDQLRLVGVVWGELGQIGLVSTTDGGGYTVRVGDRVGKNDGRVREFKKDAIVIEQVHRNALGKVQIASIEMKLRIPSRDEDTMTAQNAAALPAAAAAPAADSVVN